MPTLDPAEEWQRLNELYRRMTDEDIISLASQESELTKTAQQVLSQEVTSRGLKIEREATPPSFVETNPDSPYAKDRELTTICTVWSLEDALQVQRLLDVAGIPFYMGPEKATGVDMVTSNFAAGVEVQVMQIGNFMAWQALQNYEPLNEPESEKVEEGDLENLAVRCPKCRSTEIVLNSLAAEPDSQAGELAKFKWTCDSCGHQWEDAGMESPL